MDFISETDNTETTNANEEIVEDQTPEQAIKEDVPPSSDENEKEERMMEAGVSALPAQVVIVANTLFDNALESIEKELREQKINSPEDGEDGKAIVAEQQGKS